MKFSYFAFLFAFFSSNNLADTVVLGMSNALSGPTKNLGQQVKYGAELYFKQYNASELGKKHPIKLISYDDGYEPEQTIKNTQTLIEKDNVFALFNYVGTPTSKAILPYLEQNKAIYFSPYTGAEFLRFPHRPEFFNIRASYYNEAETQIKYFVDHLELKNIAIFIQADDFGLAASQGYLKALKSRNISKVQQVRYKRNTVNISTASKKLIQLNPDVIFCVGTYEPIAKLVNQLRENNIMSNVVTLSFAGAESLRVRLKDPQKVFITSVMPDPKNSMLPIVASYRKAMENQKLSHESLEGYINAATFAHIIGNIGDKPITKANFIKAAESKPIYVEGIDLNFSNSNHQGLSNSYLHRITNEGLIPVFF